MRVQFYAWAEFPQTLHISGSESHTPTRQPISISEAATNKNYPRPPYTHGKKAAKMEKQIILLSGTPCVGKTTISRLLAADLDGLYLNLTELAEKEKLARRQDKKRNTKIVDESEMRRKLKEIINTTEKSAVIIDGHFAPVVTPNAVAKVFVLRRNPVELKYLMEERGYKDQKLWENLASEILDICLIEALEVHGEKRVCEMDITGKEAEAVVKDILAVLQNRKRCQVGCVDWLGMLENQGILAEYLRY